MMPCPFTPTVAIVSKDPDWANSSFPYGYDINIPAPLQEVYSSGTDDSTTISNYFDIEWRRYRTTFDEKNRELNNGSAYLVGSSRVMTSLALNNIVEPIEGILADTISGAIAFRNHTVPLGFEHGAEWEEDLLFIEPETVCVNTNVTVDFEIGRYINSTVSYENVTLTDRGKTIYIL